LFYNSVKAQLISTSAVNVVSSFTSYTC